MIITDIEGAKPRKSRVIEIETRSIMKIDDIEGTKAKIRHSPRKKVQGYDAYDYSDITKAHFVSSRITNPLNPTYEGRDDSGNKIVYGAVEGSQPTKLPNHKKDPAYLPSSSLWTKDIDGA